MKKLVLVPVLFGIMITGSFFSACGNAEKETKEHNDSLPAKRDTTPQSAYVCPMGVKCGKAEKAGKCESCGMELIENKEKNKQL